MRMNENERRLAFVCLGALASIYGIQSHLARSIPHSISSAGIVIAIEAAKTVTATAALLLSGNGAIKKAFSNTTSTQLALAGIPAVLYMVQNLLMAFASRHVDGATFAALVQTKILWAALFAYLILGEAQTRKQLTAISALGAAAVPLSCNHEQASSPKDAVDNSTLVVASGVTCVLLAAALSGLSACICQRLMRKFSAIPVAWFSIEMSLFAVLPILLTTKGSWSDAVSVSTSPVVWINAVGGLLVGLVTRKLGGVAKGCAAVGGLAISSMLQYVCDRRWPTLIRGFAVFVVGFASYMHVTSSSSSSSQSRSQKVDKLEDDLAPPNTSTPTIGVTTRSHMQQLRKRPSTRGMTKNTLTLTATAACLARVASFCVVLATDATTSEKTFNPSVMQMHSGDPLMVDGKFTTSSPRRLCATLAADETLSRALAFVVNDKNITESPSLDLQSLLKNLTDITVAEESSHETDTCKSESRALAAIVGNTIQAVRTFQTSKRMWTDASRWNLERALADGYSKSQLVANSPAGAKAHARARVELAAATSNFVCSELGYTLALSEASWKHIATALDVDPVSINATAHAVLPLLMLADDEDVAFSKIMRDAATRLAVRAIRSAKDHERGRAWEMLAAVMYNRGDVEGALQAAHAALETEAINLKYAVRLIDALSREAAIVQDESCAAEEEESERKKPIMLIKTHKTASTVLASVLARLALKTNRRVYRPSRRVEHFTLWGTMAPTGNGTQYDYLDPADLKVRTSVAKVSQMPDVFLAHITGNHSLEFGTRLLGSSPLVVSSVRDPVRRFLSDWEFVGWSRLLNSTLEEWLAKNEGASVDELEGDFDWPMASQPLVNRQARALPESLLESDECFVVVHERFDESIVLLRAWLVAHGVLPPFRRAADGKAELGAYADMAFRRQRLLGDGGEEGRKKALEEFHGADAHVGDVTPFATKQVERLHAKDRRLYKAATAAMDARARAYGRDRLADDVEALRRDRAAELARCAHGGAGASESACALLNERIASTDTLYRVLDRGGVLVRQLGRAAAEAEGERVAALKVAQTALSHSTAK
ncbi:UDP-N-acetylglucosamine transporter ROCK1 [Pycnococcus provasolii]